MLSMVSSTVTQWWPEVLYAVFEMNSSMRLHHLLMMIRILKYAGAVPLPLVELTHFQALSVKMKRPSVTYWVSHGCNGALSGRMNPRSQCIVQAHRSSQTAPLIVPDIHKALEGTSMLECPDHKLDHGVPDPKCDYCKRALGPLYRHSALKESREVPILTFLTFDFSGPHPSTVHPAKQLMVIVWCLREVRLIERCD